ncbi:LTA synthase family protein [Pseudomonas boanensis]|uniref:LTA synthase family protein n=1 Tax=Metapseudomonas boanensis TaxID=2822138 RepID=UPI0035D449B9
MRPSSRWLPPFLSLASLGVLFLVIPLAWRYALGWSDHFGYLSDLVVGSFLIALIYGRPWWLGLPVMVAWSLMTMGNIELVGAVGRMPEPSDLTYLLDPQFVSNSTQGGGVGHPKLAIALAISVLACLICWRRSINPLPRYWFGVPAALLAGHVFLQYSQPSDADQWQQFNLPHKLLASIASTGQLAFEDWLDGNQPDTPPDISGLARLDLDGMPLLPGPGQARNVLVITLEGIPGAYLAANRAAINSSYDVAMMPKLSQWAERAMTTPDYVLHSHQTIRGLYAMLCGDYSKLDSGTPKGLELLNNPARAKACLPAQMRQHGFSTHFLQGAGLRFMAKDKIMPQMGFDKTLGRDWFPNKAYLEFPWGMDDKAFFEGALTYVKRLRQQKKPWMLTLLTVGTHQPYSAPADYLARYPDAKQAAIAYLDDAVDSFLQGLEKQGVLKNTLVIVTSDESHGIDKVRLASAWGFNLVLAPEQAALPPIKAGVYGHVDLEASILDYFGYEVPQNLAGRSLFREYASGREIMSYTNGKLRHHDGKDTFTECDFRQVCRRYQSEGFIADEARYLGSFSGKKARLMAQRGALLDQSLQGGMLGQEYQFATRERIKLKEKSRDDWADNLIGAQYMELPKNSRTHVQLQIRVLRMAREGAQMQLKAKEFERDVALAIPELPRLVQGKPVKLSFSFDNPEARKAFSFHLLAEGRGVIEISDFRVTTEALPPPSVGTGEQLAEQKRPLNPIKSIFGMLARKQGGRADDLESPDEEHTAIPEGRELRLPQYH